MAYNTRPTPRRLILGKMLRQARQAAGVKVNEVSKATGVAVPTIYRHEGGITGVSEQLVHQYADLYNVTSEDERLKWVKWSRNARQPGPWAASGRSLGPTYEDYADTESLAREMRIWEGSVIHGLVQTTAYSRAAISTDATVHPADSVRQEELLRFRELRKELLLRERPLPPRLWMVFGEAAIRTPPVPGDRASHREQVEHLLRVSEAQQATIQVLPWDAGLHAGLSGSFSILTFDVNVDMVFREGYGDGSFSDDEERVRSYRVRYESLQSQALSPAESRRYLHRVLDELGD